MANLFFARQQPRAKHDVEANTFVIQNREISSTLIYPPGPHTEDGRMRMDLDLSESERAICVRCTIFTSSDVPYSQVVSPASHVLECYTN